MAIQFPCSQCDKLIEIDDEWASKLVACPFCHAHVTAPGRSAPDVTARRGETRWPLEPPPPPTGAGGDVAAADLAHPRPNRVGTWGFVLGLLGLAMFLATVALLFQITNSRVRDRLATTQGTRAEQKRIVEEEWRRVQDEMAESPEQFIAAVLLSTLAVLFGVLGWFVSLWGVLRHGRRKRLALAGLVISSPAVFMLALTLAALVSQTGGPGG